MFSTPILFLVFNRPQLTQKVFNRIREVKPAKLFIAADGPRATKPGEDKLCNETRRTILENVDWVCDVHTLFRQNNLGCGRAVSEAINWFFEHVEEGIILEDDCLPSLGFFMFAEYCLCKYRNNNRVMHIGGSNLLGKRFNKNTYFYSSYSHVWGWATWKRAWSCYVYDLKLLNPYIVKKRLDTYFPQGVNTEWLKLYYLMLNQKIDTWDYQWSFALWMNKGLAIIPNHNLVSNIGFGSGATHTLDENHSFNNIPSYSLSTITSPKHIKRNKSADKITSMNVYGFKRVTVFHVINAKINTSLNNVRRRLISYLSL